MRHRWVQGRREYTTNTPYHRVLPFRSENRPASLSTLAGSVTDEARLPFDPVVGSATKECRILGRILLVAPLGTGDAATIYLTYIITIINIIIIIVIIIIIIIIYLLIYFY